VIRATVTAESIDVDGLVREASSPSCGATAIFIGTVRSSNDGRDVEGIEYSAYETMAEREMTRILEEAARTYAIESAVVQHRIGELSVGDASIAIAVAHPHRGAALDALRYIIDETKSRATIWKREKYTDGTREWVNAGTGLPG
jgi:molybdopterin synthase catalytic subunit